MSPEILTTIDRTAQEWVDYLAQVQILQAQLDAQEANALSQLEKLRLLRLEVPKQLGREAVHESFELFQNNYTGLHTALD